MGLRIVSQTVGLCDYILLQSEVAVVTPVVQLRKRITPVGILKVLQNVCPAAGVELWDHLAISSDFTEASTPMDFNNLQLPVLRKTEVTLVERFSVPDCAPQTRVDRLIDTSPLLALTRAALTKLRVKALVAILGSLLVSLVFLLILTVGLPVPLVV
nr:hypothetical protein HmN_000967800 [Hymenolepis microstoma]